jgi:hypothetical protein
MNRPFVIHFDEKDFVLIYKTVNTGDFCALKPGQKTLRLIETSPPPPESKDE